MDGLGLEILEEASTGYVHTGTAGSEAYLRFSGSQVRLLGAPTAGTQITIEVDGIEQAELCWEEGQAPGYLWGTNLDPGAHELILRVDSGTLRLDGAERWHTQQPELPTAASEIDRTSARCGCARDTAGSWLVFPALFWSRRRRRKK